MFLKAIRERIKHLFSFDSRIGYFLRKTWENLFSKDSRPGIKELSEWIELPVTALSTWRTKMPEGCRYQSFRIPKKNGRGYRKIYAPNPSLKNLQRSIYHKLLKRLHSHQAATAYITGKSILDNALPHVRQDIVVNIDLKDFFGSINSSRIYRYFRFLGWDVETSTILSNICCYERRLPQGSPTSPALSNLCNQLLDVRLEALAKSNRGKYTRYSDDITFSQGYFILIEARK